MLTPTLQPSVPDLLCSGTAFVIIFADDLNVIRSLPQYKAVVQIDVFLHPRKYVADARSLDALAKACTSIIG